MLILSRGQRVIKSMKYRVNFFQWKVWIILEINAIFSLVKIEVLYEVLYFYRTALDFWNLFKTTLEYMSRE